MREFHVLNLGAGVQSTTLYLLSREVGSGLHFSHVIFADTGEEPAAVYQHLDWLDSLCHVPILRRSAGKLGEDLLQGCKSTGQRFASIPAYTAPDHETRPEGKVKEGRTRRQCTKEYKIDVVERSIRRDILGLRPRQHMPKDVLIHQYFGISLDEECRATRGAKRFKEIKWARPHYPLIERGWTRWQCKEYLASRVPHEVPRSACVFCPFHSDAEWAKLKIQDPEGWARAVEVDNGLRKPGVVVNRGMDQKLYLHRKCLPLEMIDFNPKDPQKQLPFEDNMRQECAGMCGV